MNRPPIYDDRSSKTEGPAENHHVIARAVRPAPQGGLSCPSGNSPSGNPHLSGPGGAERRNGPQGLRIATPCGLAMTAGDGGWFLRAGIQQSSLACTAERHGGRSLQFFLEEEKTPQTRCESVEFRQLTCSSAGRGSRSAGPPRRRGRGEREARQRRLPLPSSCRSRSAC